MGLPDFRPPIMERNNATDDEWENPPSARMAVVCLTIPCPTARLVLIPTF